MIGLVLALLTANPATVQNQINAAKSGDTVVLTGMAGHLVMTNKTGVTLDASAGGYASLMINGGQQITVMGGTCGPYVYACVNAINVSGLTIRDSLCLGGGAACIVLQGVDHYLVTRNTWLHSASDGLHIAHSSYGVVTYNDCRDFKPGPGAHPDCLQIYSRAGEPAIHDVDVEHNTAQGQMQGFGNPGNVVPMYNITVRWNSYAGPYGNAGLWGLCPPSTCDISHNVATTPAGSPYQPRWVAAAAYPPTKAEFDASAAQNTNGVRP